MLPARQHLPQLDALRGIAILLVIVLHAGMYAPGIPPLLNQFTLAGRMGVQLFFLVSAYTLCLAQEMRYPDERRPLAGFFLRRFFRLAPLFYAGVLAYTLLFRDVPEPFWQPFGLGAREIIATLTFTHVWSPGSFNAVVPGGWSIGVEAAFYVCFPLLFRYLRTLPAALWALLADLVVNVPLHAGANAYLKGAYPALDPQVISLFLEWSAPAQLPVFLIGIAAYRYLHPPEDPPGPMKGAATYPALALLALLFLRFAGASQPAGWSLVPNNVLFALIFAGALIALSARPASLAVNRVTVFLGKVSFSLYIWHFITLDYLQRHITTLSPLPRVFVLFAGTLGLTAPIAYLTYRLIERPGQAVPRLILERRKAEVIGHLR